MDLAQHQLFIDDKWVKWLQRVGRRLLTARHWVEPVLLPKMPWERPAVIL